MNYSFKVKVLFSMVLSMALDLSLISGITHKLIWLNSKIWLVMSEPFHN